LKETAKHKKTPALALIIMVLAGLVLSSCARPESEPQEKESGPKREYRDIKPEVFPIPEEIRETLPGLRNDKFYLYRDISPTLNLVAYVPDYSLDAAISMAAKTFVHMKSDPEFKKGIEFWIIQIQPEPGKGAEVMVWGVRPDQADEYARTGDLVSFFRDSEYVLVNDEIIPAGEARLKAWPKKTGHEETPSTEE
jgi:hypothetical protein